MIEVNNKIGRDFFIQDVLKVAPALIGKHLVRRFDNGEVKKYIITETEAYKGGKDLACHASKGMTARTEVMFREGGLIYVYLIYGMYWMLNFVTGVSGDASAVLIRRIDNISGPGKVGKELQLNKSFYGEDLVVSKRLWIEDSGFIPEFFSAPRVGIAYAGEPWVSKPWRFIAKSV